MPTGVITLGRERMLGGAQRPAGLVLGRFESTVAVREVARQVRLERVDVVLDPSEPACGQIRLARTSVLSGRPALAGHLLGVLTAAPELDADQVRLALITGYAELDEVDESGAAPAGELPVVTSAADADVSTFVHTAVVPRRSRARSEVSEAKGS